MAEVSRQFVSEIKRILRNEQIIDDITRRRAFATDASFYQLIPQLVLKLDFIAQVRDVVRLCHEYGVAVTFRAAGTSLSGQAISDSVLIILSDKWRDYEVIDDGEFIRLQPGVIGAHANHYLKDYQRKIGPDPASINTCKIGGIVANNASGMCCGVSQNTYYTVSAMTMVLADGSIVDTGNPESVRDFTSKNAGLLNELWALSDDVKSDSELSELIRHKYRLKNTTGYALNALIDFDDPIDILMHLMVGSEGTLGFIADVTYRTVVEHSNKASGLFLFESPEVACRLVEKLSREPVDAVELLDQRALNSVKGKPGLPDAFCDNPDASTALLIETRASCATKLAANVESLSNLIAEFSPIQEIPLANDHARNEKLWAIRKATFPAVGAVRKTGTSVIIEDVAFPIDKLGQGIKSLHQLLDQYGYSEAIIFGHALAGNLHFVFTQSFETDEEVQRYDEFMQAVANLVAVDLKGSLKAEHGTGRNMAPFVELEWGEKAFQVMQRLKRIIDPKNILNPGVILNEDPDAHIRDLKVLPAANEIVDKCIECGFCEPVCPSKDLTLTPRQRISLWRRIQQLTDQQSLTEAEDTELKTLKEAYQYQGVDTCAATGMCAQKCPVGINTGDLVREIRAENTSKSSKLLAKVAADNFAQVTKVTGLGLSASKVASKFLGEEKTDKLGVKIHNTTGKTAPLWYKEWPTKAHKVKPVRSNGSDALKPLVYFPSCSSRTMGPESKSDDQRSQFEVAQSLLQKAGYQLIVPENLDNLCCGMPFSSKGLVDFANDKSEELQSALKVISQGGEIPILFDTSPCRMQIEKSETELPVFELFEFIDEFVLSELSITPVEEPIALHITCSSRKMGLAETLRRVANTCSTEVIEPHDIECCGFAGDKGMFYPELNESALKTLAKQLPDNCTQGFSNSRTCEIGLSHYSKIQYQSLLYLLDKVSEARPQ